MPRPADAHREHLDSNPPQENNMTTTTDLTCTCTTNPTCPEHGDAEPVPTRKEQRDALFAHDPVATTLRAHAWMQDRNACSCGLHPTHEPPYYFNAGAGRDWHALHVANQFTALGLETAGDWRWVRVRVTAATPEDVESARSAEGDDFRSLADEVLALGQAEYDHSLGCPSVDGDECACWRRAYIALLDVVAEVPSIGNPGVGTEPGRYEP